MRKISVLVVLPALKKGGAERVMTHIMKHLPRDDFNLKLLLLKKEGELLKEIPDDVIVCEFGRGNKISSFTSLYLNIRKANADVVFSSLSLNLHIALLIPFFSKNIGFVARESNMPSEKIKKYRFPKMVNWLYRYYNRFDYVICQSQLMKNDFVENGWVNVNKLKIINNPVDLSTISTNVIKNSAPINDVSVKLLMAGRICRQKRIDRAIDLIKKLPQSYSLTVIGRDMMVGEMQRRTSDYDLNHRVGFPGEVDNPYLYMYEADILLLLSDYEGFPNVVIEAIACGTPVVAFKNIAGIDEIIIDGFNGYKVDDSDDVYNLLIDYDKNFGSIDTSEIRNDVSNRFNMKNIIKEYSSVFIGATSGEQAVYNETE